MLFETLKKLLQKDFVRFAVVGAFGFCAQVGLYYLLLRIINNPGVALILSTEGAFLCTFTFHSRWTYGPHPTKGWLQLLLEYHGSSLLGLAMNVLIVGGLMKFVKLQYIEAQIITSATVLFWNFLATKYFVWRKKNPTLHEQA